jgi:hypothetical protein
VPISCRHSSSNLARSMDPLRNPFKIVWKDSYNSGTGERGRETTGRDGYMVIEKAHAGHSKMNPHRVHTKHKRGAPEESSGDGGTQRALVPAGVGVALTLAAPPATPSSEDPAAAPAEAAAAPEVARSRAKEDVSLSVGCGTSTWRFVGFEQSVLAAASRS